MKHAHSLALQLAHINNSKDTFARSRGTDLKDSLRDLDCKMSEAYTMDKREGSLIKKYKKANVGFYRMGGQSYSSSEPAWSWDNHVPSH